MFSFLSISLVRFVQPRRSAPKEGDKVTATRDCGRVTAILYSWLATRLRSVAGILPIHLFTITQVPVCNHIPLITIRMPIRPNAGVSALTPKLVHRDTANAATKHMTQDAHLKVVRKTGSSKNKKHHAVGCEYIHIEVNGRQLPI